MKLFASLAISLVATTAAADVTVMDNNQSVTVDCAKDKNVQVVGNSATVTLTGVCEKVYVSGNNATVSGSTKGAYVAGNSNTLTLDAVDTISTPGNHNTVTYKKPATKKKTSVSNPGNKNKISQSK